MKKILSIVGIVVLVLIVVVLLFLGSIVKTGIEKVGPKIAGVPINVEKVVINPLGGVVNVKGLIIGNPEGFKTDSAMDLGEFKLDIAMGSLFSDTIVIKQILVDAPEITYERGLKTSNLGTLLDTLKAEEKQEEETVVEETPKEKAVGKKVIIEDFQLNDAKIHATFTAMGGRKMQIPLGSIQMTDIGKESGGTSVIDATTEVLTKVVASVGTAASGALSGAGDLAGDTLKGAGDLTGDTLKGAGDAVKGTTDAAKDATDALKKGIGGLFGKEE
jgi:uncharacterized protein involved in outer membrane biogenesis